MRQRLPNRRHALTFDFEHAGLKYTATVGRFPDGRVAEVFIRNHKTNSGADVNARDAAIILSFALQHGADISAIGRALSRDPRGHPSGVMGAVLDIIGGSAP
jgi:ribonucleoside-diphosphate reductase alpha chain